MTTHHRERGQGHLEVLLIATAVVVIGFVFTTIYLSSQESTKAMVIAKNTLIQTFNVPQKCPPNYCFEEPTLIKSIRYQLDQATIIFQIETQRNLSTAEKDLATNAVRTAVQANVTTFTRVNLEFSP